MGRTRDILEAVERPVIVGLAIAAAATIVLVKLLDSIRENDTVVRLDHNVTTWFIARRTDTNMSIMRVITRLADTWTVAAVVTVAAGLLFVRRQRMAAVFVIVSSAGTAVLVAVAKVVVGRSRPPAFDAIVGVNGYAFPSGHAAQSVACYGSLAIVGWSLTTSRRAHAAIAAGAVVTVIAVGMSRVWLGVHWLSDVFAGWALAAGWLGLVVSGSRMIARTVGPTLSHPSSGGRFRGW